MTISWQNTRNGRVCLNKYNDISSGIGAGMFLIKSKAFIKIWIRVPYRYLDLNYSCDWGLYCFQLNYSVVFHGKVCTSTTEMGAGGYDCSNRTQPCVGHHKTGNFASCIFKFKCPKVDVCGISWPKTIEKSCDLLFICMDSLPPWSRPCLIVKVS